MLDRKQIIINFTAYMYVKDSVLLWCYALGCNTSDLHTTEAKGTVSSSHLEPINQWGSNTSQKKRVLNHTTMKTSRLTHVYVVRSFTIHPPKKFIHECIIPLLHHNKLNLKLPSHHTNTLMWAMLLTG